MGKGGRIDRCLISKAMFSVFVRFLSESGGRASCAKGSFPIRLLKRILKTRGLRSYIRNAVVIRLNTGQDALYVGRFIRSMMPLYNGGEQKKSRLTAENRAV